MTSGHPSPEQVFHEARAIKAVSEREGYLRGACGNDAALRAKVEALLHADAEAGSFLASAGHTAGTTVAAAPHEQAGTMIGRYKLLQPIGEGGFGVVWMAEQKKPVKRRVALKIIKLGMDTKQVVARFEAERQALAMMDHPNISTVLDGGATDTGRPYFVMELVKGVPITEYCDQNNLTIPQRLDLFKLVCAAVQHAHQKGIIHRDIKPSNVLVTLHDGKPVPKVIDFGIAKATNAELTEKTLFTEHRQMIGTPEYMSPEQAEMSGLDIDTRSDIYALGVLLYELLTGTTPFDGKRLREAGLNEIQRIIREEEPHKPSTRLSTLDTLPTIAAHRGIEPRKLGLMIRGDLDWIIMKALEKDRTRRYETANGFAADIDRHLGNEPVLASPPSTVYRVRKFVRRNRRSVIGAGALLVVLLGGIAGTSVGLMRTELARADAVSQRHIAEVAEREQSRERERAQEAQADAETQRDAARRQSYVASIVAAQASIQAGGIKTARVRLEKAPDELRGWEWDYLHAQLDHSLAVLRGHEGGVNSVAFSPDGKRIVSASSDNTLKLWDVATGEEVLTLRGHDSWVACVAFSPDGKRIASGSGSTVRLWDASSGEELAVLRGHEMYVSSVVFSPDGSRIASGSWDKTVRLWDASSGEELLVMRGHVAVHLVAFSPDGSRIASGSGGETLRLWDASSGEELAVLRGHSPEAFSPDGSRIASGSGDKTVRLWDASSGEELAVLRGHEQFVSSVAFSPDGSRIASGSEDHTVRLWDASSREEVYDIGAYALSFAFSPDGSRIASAGKFGALRLWDASSGEELAVLRGHRADVHSVAFSPDGSRIASGGWDHTVRLWDATTCEQLAVLRHEVIVNSVAFSPDGSRIVSGSETLRLWDASTGDELLVLRGHEDEVKSVAFSPDGSRIASGSWDNTVRLWDAASGEELDVLSGHENSVNSVAFSPDGSRIASGSDDKTVRLWDASSGEELAVLRGDLYSVTSVAFSPDGSRIASLAWSSKLRLWDTVAYRDRVAERDEARRDSATIHSLVEELFRKGLDCSAVADRVRDDASLSDPLRRAAINLVMKRCSEIRERARDTGRSEDD